MVTLIIANSVLQISGGGTAKDVIVKSGAILKLSGDFTLENVVVEEGAVIDWATPSSGFELINTFLPNYENVKYGDGVVYNWYTSTTFKPDGSLKFVDLTIKDLDYNGLAFGNGATDIIDGMVFDCDPNAARRIIMAGLQVGLAMPTEMKQMKFIALHLMAVSYQLQ